MRGGQALPGTGKARRGHRSGRGSEVETEPGRAGGRGLGPQGGTRPRLGPAPPPAPRPRCHGDRQTSRPREPRLHCHSNSHAGPAPRGAPPRCHGDRRPRPPTVWCFPLPRRCRGRRTVRDRRELLWPLLSLPAPVESHSPPVIATALHRIAINSGGKAPLRFRRCSGRVWPRRHPRSMVRGAPRVPRAAAGTREERGGGRWPVRGLSCPGAAPARGRHGAGGA